MTKARTLPGAPDDIAPDRVDVLASTARRQKRKRAPMPENLAPFTQKARARLERLPASPGVMIEPSPDGGSQITSPHDNADAWEVQIASAFGTRSVSAIKTFVGQLKDLCGTHWTGEHWKPSETELNAALAIVNDCQPRNSAQAALCAQMVAVHFMQMRMSSQALGSGIMDHRDAAIAAKLARTYAIQLDALERAQGRKQTARQTIRVRKELHQHVHYHRGGGESGAQPQGRIAAPAHQCAALPSEEPGGQVVSLPRRSGKAGV